MCMGRPVFIFIVLFSPLLDLLTKWLGCETQLFTSPEPFFPQLSRHDTFSWKLNHNIGENRMPRTRAEKNVLGTKWSQG